MLRLLPWRFFVKHAARRYGVIDPATFIARIRSFAQPSEVAEPMELLRAGIVFHARGLVNAKAIQHNLDWVWPYWVERQFNPHDLSFVPRAFSFSHINLTHRNWTAVGHPDLPVYPIVDPRGLVTPLHDGWSLDFWIVTDSERRLLPSRTEDDAVKQELILNPTLEIATQVVCDDLGLKLRTRVDHEKVGGPTAVTEVCASTQEDGWLVVAVRPYNPEGIQFIQRIQWDNKGFDVNREAVVEVSDCPDALRMAHYAEGDVYLNLSGKDDVREVECEVGMATAAALFRLKAGSGRKLHVSVGLNRDLKLHTKVPQPRRSWRDALDDGPKLQLPDPRTVFLFDAAMRTLLLLSADDFVPGPYTYRRFWFRDACLMLHPLIATGHVNRAERILRTFARRQTMSGYFLSQEGEWDSNGQVLWIAARFAELTGRTLWSEFDHALRKAVHWLDKKRVAGSSGDRTAGLLPAGFSAEHLGPNDYYYWDDFWAWGGLKAIAGYWDQTGNHEWAAKAKTLADGFERSIEASIAALPQRRVHGAVPAAPGRRMDAGAIGSMVADYPLQLYAPSEPRLAKTMEFLIRQCFHHGCFFQEMIHSGINAYLTLDLAQTLLRAGDARHGDLIRSVAAVASPTGQWPEAIHPHTHGGCMGDGQHGWAAAEWIMMMRNCFIREEADHLVVGSGILPEWLDGSPLSFGPTLTRWGSVSIHIALEELSLETDWRSSPPRILIAVPGYLPIDAEGSDDIFRLRKS